MPGFAVGVVSAGLGVAAATEQEAGGPEEGFQRHDVPGVFGDDVGGEEVDLPGKVGNGAASGVTLSVEGVKAFGRVGGAFDLHAPEERSWMWRAPGMRRGLAEGAENGAGEGTGFRGSRPGTSLTVLRGLQDRAGGVAAAGGSEFAGVEDDVVAFTVAERLGDTETEAGGFEGEGQFGKFSAAFGGELAMAGRLRARRR